MIIGDDIKVQVLSVSGSQVKLGITAPKEITVHREEVYQLILEERAVAKALEKAHVEGQEE